MLGRVCILLISGKLCEWRLQQSGAVNVPVPGGSRLSQRDEVSKLSQRDDTSNRNARFSRTSLIRRRMLHPLKKSHLSHEPPPPPRIFSFRPTDIIFYSQKTMKRNKPKEVYIDKIHSITLMTVTTAQQCKAPTTCTRSLVIYTQPVHSGRV